MGIMLEHSFKPDVKYNATRGDHKPNRNRQDRTGMHQTDTSC